MKITAAILVSLAVGVLHSRRDSAATNDPLIEFTYTDESRAQDSSAHVQQCGYYILVRGTIGHSGGFRPGASVHLQGDTLTASVNVYRSWAFDPRDWAQARWTLRIGGLDPRAYHVTVSVAGTAGVQREARLTFRDEHCPA